MNAFQFQTVPTIISEFGAARQLGALLRKQYPAQVRLCVVTDGFLHKSGLLAPALADLARHGWQVTVIDDVVADPPESVVLDAAERARQADAEVVLGLGGGSSMDVAKLLAVLLAGQHAARLMVSKGWGRIVNISSISGIRAGAGRTAYGTSKAAVIGLTRQMAIELAQYGITVNSVAPGPVDTPMTQAMHSEQTRESYYRLVPMRRYGTTDEIASAVCYLAAEESAYITGHVIPVDGGFVAGGVLEI